MISHEAAAAVATTAAEAAATEEALAAAAGEEALGAAPAELREADITAAEPQEAEAEVSEAMRCPSAAAAATGSVEGVGSKVEPSYHCNS